MDHNISRRDFLKVAGLGGGLSAVLTGCGTAARYVERQPYGDMPEYNQTGKSTYFATTCGECPAACGLIVRTMEGRAHKVEGNPDHPVNRGNTCARGQATLQGLYNPDRVKGPQKQAVRSSGRYEQIQWETAVGVVKDALLAGGGEALFLLGLHPDHLFDLVQRLATAAGNASVLRYGVLGEFEARATLLSAAEKLLGARRLPYFDIERALVTFSFGANFSETWLSPVAYSRAYGIMRQGHPGQRGYLVQFEPRMSQTAANADEWIPITPGSEALLAQALARLVADKRNMMLPSPLSDVDIAAAAAASGVTQAELERLAGIFADSPRPVALPGSLPLGQPHGLAAAQAILALNVLADNLGREGGTSFVPETSLIQTTQAPNTTADLLAAIDRMNNGQVRALFIHGANPAYELPASAGFAAALEKVPLVISFASFLDETALLADYVLPDHTPLESWGFQRVLTGSDRAALSALQPVVVPVVDSRATADVLLAAVQGAGGSLAQALPFGDVADYLQQTLRALPELNSSLTGDLWTTWLQHGGWWPERAGLDTPSTGGLDGLAAAGDGPQALGEGELYLLPFPHPNLGDGSGANRPWLQETPDPMTTVMWNSWVEINPATARALGVKNDEVVKITSAAGSIEAVVYEYPAIHPQVIAIPLGQGHTALGRYAQGRGANPLGLLELVQNEAGNLAFTATKVKVQSTGRRKILARFESREGIYGPTGEAG